MEHRDLFVHSTLGENCPNTGFFLVRIFPYSDGIRENANQTKIPYLDTFSHGGSDDHDKYGVT